MSLTEPERDQMAHAIGHHSAKGCSVNGGRNHYVTQTGDPLWVSLVGRGLARCRRVAFIPETESVFHVTNDGRDAVAADPRSQRVGRSFTVYFRGYDHTTTIWTTTHGKARYQAALDIMDAWNCDAIEAFKLIESCRLS